MRLLIKSARIPVLLLLVLFVSLFIYANWQRPSLGERLYMENPTQIVVMNFPAAFTAADSAALNRFFLGKEGVYSNVITLSSKTLCVTIDPRKTDRTRIIGYAEAFNPAVRERVMAPAGPQCPVDGPLYTFQRIKYALCLRK